MSRGRFDVCMLSEAEAIAVEQHGFLQRCGDHNHCSRGRALRDVERGLFRLANPKRVDAPYAVVRVIREEDDGRGEWWAERCADGGANIMQFHRRSL